MTRIIRRQIMLRMTEEEYQDLERQSQELGHTYPDTVRVRMGWRPILFPKETK